MKGRTEEKSEGNWKPDSTQGKVRRRNRHIAKFCRKFRKRNKGKNTDSLCRAVTLVHTQKPVRRLKEDPGKCKFCMRKGKGEIERDEIHEAWCRSEESGLKEVWEGIDELAAKMKQPWRKQYSKKTSEEEESSLYTDHASGGGEK